MNNDEAPNEAGSIALRMRAGVSVMLAVDPDTGNDQYEALLSLAFQRHDGEVFDVLLKRDACEMLSAAIEMLDNTDPDTVMEALAESAIESALS